MEPQPSTDTNTDAPKVDTTTWPRWMQEAFQLDAQPAEEAPTQ